MREPHFISGKLLKALGGIKRETPAGTLVDEGAYLWGMEDRDKGEGVLRHVLSASRVAYALVMRLRESGAAAYQHIDPRLVIEATLLHDIAKLYGEERERLAPSLKEALGIPLDFREISPQNDEIAIVWLQKLGFSSDVCEAIQNHDFPQNIVDNPYWKIVLLADYMAGKKIMTVQERLNDVRHRWIEIPQQDGLPPRIEPERYRKAARNVQRVAEEIFEILKTTDKDFIRIEKLDGPASESRWEKFLLSTREQHREKRASELVEYFIDGKGKRK